MLVSLPEDQQAVQLVLSLLRQLSADSVALQPGLSAEWLAEHLPALPYAEAVTRRAATCSRKVVDEECSICICEIEEDEQCRLLPCSHIFHAACIDKWFARSSFCPCCKAEVH